MIRLKFELFDEDNMLTKVEREFENYWAENPIDTLVIEFGNFLKAAGFTEKLVDDYLYTSATSNFSLPLSRQNRNEK